MKLANRFEILEILDQGGYGVTYRAVDHHQSGRSQCVLKELVCNSSKVSERLLEEVSVLEKIGTHTRIPKLFAYFNKGKKFYIAQEMIYGHDLRQEIKVGKSLDESYVTKLLKDVLTVLAFVHQNQTIHRDINPANLVRQDSNGDIFLINFGMVNALCDSQTESSGRPMATVKVVTAGYVAPEQLRGKPCYASDLYSVGMVAVAALTEIHPRQLKIHPLTHQVQWSNEAINPALETFIKRLIAPRPSHRYLTAVEALKDFERILTGIRVGQDSQLPTHVAAGIKPPESVAATMPVKLIPPKLILRVMGGITAVLLGLGFGVKGYQWAAYHISRRLDRVTAAPKGYDEADQLVALLDDGSIQASPEMVNAFWTMVAAAEDEGVELLPLAGYISMSEQREQLKQRADVDIDEWLQQSDYHSGYAVAIGDKNADESTDWDISFEQTDGYRWLRRYAKTYGFELSYPQGNPAGEKEPWHWRYSSGTKRQ